DRVRRRRERREGRRAGVVEAGAYGAGEVRREVVGGQAQLEAVALGQLVGGRPDREVVVVIAAGLDRLWVGVGVPRDVGRGARGVERTVRGAQKARRDDRLAAVGRDIGELGEPVGVARRRGR